MYFGAYLLLNKIEHLSNWLRNWNILLYLLLLTRSIQLLQDNHYPMKILIYVQDLILFIVPSYCKKSAKCQLKQLHTQRRYHKDIILSLIKNSSNSEFGAQAWIKLILCQTDSAIWLHKLFSLWDTGFMEIEVSV